MSHSMRSTGPPIFVKLALHLEGGGAQDVAIEIVAGDADAGVVAPFVRIPDFVGDSVQLDAGPASSSPESSR